MSICRSTYVPVKRTILSTYLRLFIVVSLISMPMVWSSSFLLTKSSDYRSKRIGESINSWWTPLRSSISSDVSFFSCMLLFGYIRGMKWFLYLWSLYFILLTFLISLFYLNLTKTLFLSRKHAYRSWFMSNHLCDRTPSFLDLYGIAVDLNSILCITFNKIYIMWTIVR